VLLSLTFIFNKPASVSEHPNQTLAAQQSVTQIILRTIVNLVTPKGGAERELLFNKPTPGDLFSCLGINSS